MKKKFILGILIASMLFSTSCSSNKGGENETETEETFVSEVLLNSFENYYDCYDMDFSGGRADFVKDELGVTDGEKAMLLTPSKRSEGKQTSITMGVRLYEVQGNENNYRDFSNMHSVTFDVYNGSENEISVATSIKSKGIAETYSNVQITKISAKTKQTVTYMVNRYEIYYALGIKNPSHVNVAISGVDMQTYVDNMRLHYVEDSFSAVDGELKENELISFEQAFQAFAVTTTGANWKAEVVADMENASEGNCYVRAYRPDYPNGVQKYVSGKLCIAPNYLENIKFDKFPSNAYIAYDYRTSWIGSGKMWVVPRLVSFRAGGYANIRGGSLVCDGQWHTFYIPLSWAPSFFDKIEIDLCDTSYGDIYFDNFRIATSIPKGEESFVAESSGLT